MIARHESGDEDNFTQVGYIHNVMYKSMYTYMYMYVYVSMLFHSSSYIHPPPPISSPSHHLSSYLASCPSLIPSLPPSFHFTPPYPPLYFVSLIALLPHSPFPSLSPSSLSTSLLTLLLPLFCHSPPSLSLQVGWFYRKALNEEERTRLVQNIAGHLKNAAEFIQERAVSQPHTHTHTHTHAYTQCFCTVMFLLSCIVIFPLPLTR